MNSTRFWLALVAALGSPVLIACIFPRPVPPSLPAPQVFRAMSASVTVLLEDDPLQLDDGQILGELRNPMASGSEQTPSEATPPKRRKPDRDQTRADAVSGRADIKGLAMAVISIDPAPLSPSPPCPSPIPSTVVSSLKPLDGQPWRPGQPIHP